MLLFVTSIGGGLRPVNHTGLQRGEGFAPRDLLRLGADLLKDPLTESPDRLDPL